MWYIRLEIQCEIVKGSVAEWSKALVLGTSQKWRGFESHRCQNFFYIFQFLQHKIHDVDLHFYAAICNFGEDVNQAIYYIYVGKKQKESNEYVAVGHLRKCVLLDYKLRPRISLKKFKLSKTHFSDYFQPLLITQVCRYPKPIFKKDVLWLLLFYMPNLDRYISSAG